MRQTTAARAPCAYRAPNLIQSTSLSVECVLFCFKIVRINVGEMLIHSYERNATNHKDHIVFSAVATSHRQRQNDVFECVHGLKGGQVLTYATYWGCWYESHMFTLTRAGMLLFPTHAP